MSAVSSSRRRAAPRLIKTTHTYTFLFLSFCINMTGLIIVQNPIERNQVGAKNWRNAIDFPFMAWIEI